MDVTRNLLAATGLAWLMLYTTPASVAAAQLLDGTVVHVRLLSPISSEDAKAGDRIGFIVIRDVVADGVVVIPRGTPAEGAVVRAQRSSWGFTRHRAVLAFGFTQTTGLDGQLIRLRASNTNGQVNIDRSDYHHGLQWASEGDTFEAFVIGNYGLRGR